MGRKYDAVIFDLDGTLLDYATAQRRAVEEAAEELGLGQRNGGLMELVGSREVQALEACRPNAPDAESPEMAEAFMRCGVNAPPKRFLDTYYARLSKQHGTVDGALQVLDELKRRNLPVGLVSNGPGHVQRPRIRESGIIEYLDAIVLSCEVGMAKPDPEILRLALRLLEAEAGSALFVGDSTTSDMPAAEGAGVDFVLITPDGDSPGEGARVLDATTLKQAVEPVLGAVDRDASRG